MPTSKEEKGRVKKDGVPSIGAPSHRSEAAGKRKYLKRKQRAESQIVEEGHRAGGIDRCARPESARPDGDRNGQV